MRIVICEDNPNCRKDIIDNVHLWAKRGNHCDYYIQEFQTPEDLLEEWKKGIQADLFLLDIQFPHDIDGVDLARRIRMWDERVAIVFITHSQNYLRAGYDVRAWQYLNKPVCYEDLAECLDIVHRQCALTGGKEHFVLDGPGSRVAIPYAKILYFEVRSPYTLIYLVDEEDPLTVRRRFAEFLGRLPPALFVLCHRSYIVNVMYVRSIEGNGAFLPNGTRIPIAKPFKKALNHAVDCYQQGRGLKDGLDIF